MIRCCKNKRSLPNNILTNVVSVDNRRSTARRPSPTLHPDLQFYDTQLLEKMDEEENGEIDNDVSIAHGILLVFVANFCVDTGSSRKPKFVFSDESDTSETSSDESNDSTGDDSSDSNEDSDISKVISTPCAPVEKEYTFQELFGFEKTRAAYVDFRVCPSHVHLTCERLMLNT